MISSNKIKRPKVSSIRTMVILSKINRPRVSSLTKKLVDLGLALLHRVRVSVRIWVRVRARVTVGVRVRDKLRHQLRYSTAAIDAKWIILYYFCMHSPTIHHVIFDVFRVDSTLPNQIAFIGAQFGLITILFLILTLPFSHPQLLFPPQFLRFVSVPMFCSRSSFHLTAFYKMPSTTSTFLLTASSTLRLALACRDSPQHFLCLFFSFLPCDIRVSFFLPFSFT